MNKLINSNQKFSSNIGNHLSNERTYLSQLRTSIAFMSFGITLNRFSIYLLEHDRPLKSGLLLLREGKYIGLGMVLLAMLLLGWSQYRFKVVTRQIEETNYTPPALVFTAITAMVLLLGAASALWLIRNE